MAFHLHRDGQSTPFDLMTLRDMARKGDLAQDEYIYDDKKGEWIGAAQVPEMTGSWNIGESEATVAMELPPDFGAMFDEMAAKKAAASAPKAAEPAPRAPEPMRAPEPAPRQPAPQAPAPRQREPEMQRMDGGDGGRGHDGDGGGQRGGRGQGGGRSGGGGSGRNSGRTPGEILDPIKTTGMNVICFIFSILWIMKRFKEINAFLGEDRLVFWHMFIPILNLITLWKFFKSVSEMAGLVGAQVEDRAVMYLLGQLCTGGILTFYFMQTDLNTIWTAAGGRPA